MKKLFRLNLILSAVIGVLALSSFTFSNDQDSSIYLPHPDYCNIFYEVFNGVLIAYRCPDGLCFSDELDVCIWPEDAHPGRPCKGLWN